MAILTGICLMVFLGGLALAALCDLVSLTIPNRVVVAVAGAAALGLISATADPIAWGWHFGVFLAVLAGGAVLFFVNVWGAGDAKLLAAAALACGLDGLAPLMLWTAVSGGILALILVVLRRQSWLAKRRLRPWCRRLLEPGGGVPYGVAIAIGGILAVAGGHTVLTGRFIIS